MVASEADERVVEIIRTARKLKVSCWMKTFKVFETLKVWISSSRTQVKLKQACFYWCIPDINETFQRSA